MAVGHKNVDSRKSLTLRNGALGTNLPATKVDPLISVITATLNVADKLPTLWQSLRKQSFHSFEWIVFDGGSTDGTLALLEAYSASCSWMRYQSTADFGIYDALNRGITAAAGDFYVVAGADDEFDEQSLTNYADHLNVSRADVVLAQVVRDGAVIGGFSPKLAWIGHSKAFKGSHSVGMLIRKSLHQKYGFYSSRLPLLADGFFLKKALYSGEVNFHQANFVAGRFGTSGVSSIRKVQTLAETWQIQMLTERAGLLQTVLFIGKIVFRLPGIIREANAIVKRKEKKKNI